MTAGPLAVMYESRTVGTLKWSDKDGFLFTYSPEWISWGGSFAISLSLPLSSAESTGEAAGRFFANLLPEGRLRHLVTRRLGISEDNDFELLRAVGGECAGALSVVSENSAGTKSKAGTYKPLSTASLKKFQTSGPVYPAIASETGIRLSLAGAQDKLPVLLRNNKLFLPLENSPSSHILKFSNRDFKHLPANEIITTWTARACGLPVVETALLAIGEDSCCVVQRYDRRFDNDGDLHRLHQEDLCQALGYPSIRKYQHEGGPSFADCFSVVQRNSSDTIADTEALIKWQVFNLLMGNSDGHAKNVSILYEGANRIRLAPFYDLVCTACYPNLDRHLALSIGDCTDAGQISGKHWRIFAEQLDIRFQYLKEMVADMAGTLPDAAAGGVARFRSEYSASPIAEIILQSVVKRTRRTLKLLRDSTAPTDR